MKSDISRNTFDPAKHFSRVLMQQGRVQLDADWNEQASILLHYLRTLATDLIGPHGGPVSQCGFEIIDANALVDLGEAYDSKQAAQILGDQGFFIGKGRYYVDGLLCENELRTPYAEQRDYPLPHEAEQVKNLAGPYVVYLDVWERHIGHAEDESLREVALGGVDTAARAKVVWQVKLLKLGSASACADGARLLHTSLVERRLPRLRARVKPEPASTDPCVISAESRYRGPENQLYRVEIHQVSEDGKTATFKWSRENGSVVLPILEIKTGGATGRTVVSLAHLGRDAKLGVGVQDWVELVDDDYALQNRAETLLKVESIDPVESTVTLLGSTTVGANPAQHPLLRRWDHRAGDPQQGGLELDGGAAQIPATGGAWLNLEDGVQIQFGTGGTYRTGDYWLIPARTATGKVEWPQEPGDGEPKPAALPPHGIVHHYAPLGIISVAGGKVTRERDCRCRFEPLRCAYGYGYQFSALGIGPDWPE